MCWVYMSMGTFVEYNDWTAGGVQNIPVRTRSRQNGAVALVSALSGTAALRWILDRPLYHCARTW